MRKSIPLVLLIILIVTLPGKAQDYPRSAAPESPAVGAPSSSVPDLTAEEWDYLAKKKVIKVCVDPAWMPFEAIVNSAHVGMSADYLALISRMLGVRFQLVPTASWNESLANLKSRKCDILTLAMETSERKAYANFTQPYFVIPLVIATTKEKPFIADLSDVSDMRLGMVKGYAFSEFLKVEYPDIDIKDYDSVYDGLAALEKGEIYGFIDNLTTIAYEITRSFSSSLKISGRINRNWELGIAVRNDDPVLFSVMDKAVRSVDRNVMQQLQAKWISVTYEQPFDYALLWRILAVAALVAALFTYRFLKIQSFNTTLRGLNQRLQESEASFRSLTDNAHEGIAVVQNMRLVYVNPSVCALTGYSRAELMGLESYSALIDPEQRAAMVSNHVNRLSGKDAPVRYETVLLRSDGSRCPIEMTGVLISWNGERSTLNVLSDISERKATEEAVRFMALHDNLTRLPNRYLLKDRLERAIAHARRSGRPFALLFLDLNGFKKVNDTHGHDVGDLLLKGIAERLQSLMRESDTLARMGGDEFVALFPQVDGRAGVESLIARIDETTRAPFFFGSLEIRSSASVGFALFPEDGRTEEDLLRVADMRMYQDKQARAPDLR